MARAWSRSKARQSVKALVMTDWQEKALIEYGANVERVPWTMPQGYPALLSGVGGLKIALLGGCTPVPKEREWHRAEQWLDEGKEVLVPFRGHKQGPLQYHLGMMFLKRSEAVLHLLDRWETKTATENPWGGFRSALLECPVRLWPLPATWWKEAAHPGIAVVIPCYAHENFVAEAARSALAARADQVIVVDDGSPGDVVGALSALAGEPVYVVKQENAGLPTARNIGIRLATMSHVLSLDADDRVDDRVLRSMFARTRMEMAWSFSDVYLHGAVNKRVTVRITQETMQNMQPSHPAVMYQRAAWAFVGGYDETIGGFESWDYQARLMQAGYAPIKAKGLVHYRKHDGPSMLSGVLKNKEHHLEELRKRNVAFFGGEDGL